MIFWEKVTTTNFTTSKTKKNIKKLEDHHYIKNLHWSDQNVEKEKDQNIEKPKITTSKLVDHYYENHNVENQKEHRKICKPSQHWKWLLSWSQLRHHNIENGFWVDHNYDITMSKMAIELITTSKRIKEHRKDQFCLIFIFWLPMA